MNKGPSESLAFFSDFKNLIGKDESSFQSHLSDSSLSLGFAPPFISLESSSQTLKSSSSPLSNILLGAQNCHWDKSGAQTGEVSYSMLKELSCDFVITGHSERRQFYGETNQTVSKRSIAALENKLLPVICIGESKEEFEAGETASVVSKQLSESLSGITIDSILSSEENIIIAYEPIWAIGTGLAASPEDAQKTHSIIRKNLSDIFNPEIAQKTPILYGGSVKAENIAELSSKPDINGALVGGASLKPGDFFDLINNAKF